MKRFLLLSFLLLEAVLPLFAQVSVRGYYRKNGTYVQPHQRTRPNHTTTDNYSYPGNYNPNTGRVTGGSTPSYPSNYGTPSYGSSGSSNYTGSSSPPATYNSSSDSYSSKNVYSTPTVETYSFSSPAEKYVLSDGVVRTSPSTSSSEAFRIKAGTRVSLVAKHPDFYKVNHNGREGYIHFLYIDGTYNAFLAASYPRPQQRGKTDTEALLRERPDPNSSIVYRMPAGATFKLIDKHGYYWQVEAGGMKGYIHEVYVIKQ